MPKYKCIFENKNVVKHYENLRIIDSSVLNYTAHIIIKYALKNNGDNFIRILDAGAGDGRFLKPIIEISKKHKKSFFLIAIDLSKNMLANLLQRISPLPIGVKLIAIKSDICHFLPIKDEKIDIVFTIATLHILTEWRKSLDNLLSTIRYGGYIIIIKENNQFMHQTEGFEHDNDFHWIDFQLKEFMLFYHEQRRKFGCPYEPSEIRYSDMTSVIDYLKTLGLKKVDFSVDLKKLQWSKPHTYKDIIYCFRHRQMTTWGSELPDKVRIEIAKSLEKWIYDREIIPNQTFYLPAELIPYIFQKI